jgi:hypothetical protein
MNWTGSSCGLRVLDGGHHQRHNAAMVVRACDEVAQPRHQRVIGRARRFALACRCRQLVEARTEQGFEQRLTRRKVTEQRREPYVGSACDVAHRRIGALLGDDGARDGEQVVAILPGVGPHPPLPAIRIGDPLDYPDRRSIYSDQWSEYMDH